MRRLMLLVLVAGLVAAACSGDTSTTTTTVATTTTVVPTTTVPTGRVTLQQNGPAFILEGSRGPYVEALQHYLVCTGHGQPVADGASVGVDGVFGPITADAVASYQAELRRVPTGDPDEDTFASLARDCDEERTVAFEEGASTTQVAGNAAPGDDDVLVVPGQDGQVLSLQAVEGTVGFTVEGADGDLVEADTVESTWQAELPSDQEYRIVVSATAPTSYLLNVSTRSPNVVASDFGPMRLEPDGLAIADFGDDPENTIAVVSLVLGSPLDDTGWQEAPGCTGSNRHVLWAVQLDTEGLDHPAALILDFADLGGTPFFAQYAYRSFDLAALDPMTRGLTTPEGITLGSDLEAFTDAYGTVEFFDAVRGLTELDSGLVAGFEEGAEPADRLAWYIGAGADGCADFQ